MQSSLCFHSQQNRKKPFPEIKFIKCQFVKLYQKKMLSLLNQKKLVLKTQKFFVAKNETTLLAILNSSIFMHTFLQTALFDAGNLFAFDINPQDYKLKKVVFSLVLLKTLFTMFNLIYMFLELTMCLCNCKGKSI